MTQSTNIKAAESVIRDVDYAEESANFNKLNIISQAGSYAISQSNATQQNVLDYFNSWKNFIPIILKVWDKSQFQISLLLKSGDFLHFLLFLQFSFKLIL